MNVKRNDFHKHSLDFPPKIIQIDSSDSVFVRLHLLPNVSSQPLGPSKTTSRGWSIN